MCDHCGCTIVDDHHHEHSHDHDHEHNHDHAHERGREIEVQRSILSRNERLAERNRGMFLAHKLTVLNLMSSPGSGKTALIERTVQDARAGFRTGVIVGDLATENDAQRIQGQGVPAVQITTGTACHLDAHMVHHALEKIDMESLDLLFIENVGNLVCPASFDLGEEARVVIMAVTEGEDKPLKYPVIFNTASVVVVNKMDLSEAVGFQRDAARANIAKVAPRAEIIELSARTGEGMDAWFNWLRRRIAGKVPALS